MTTSFRNVSALVAAALVMAAVSASVRSQDNLSPVQDAAAKNAEVTQLTAVLKSDAAPFDKAKACQRLALIGTPEAVPALAVLLADERLGTYARFGLERIPDPSVDNALREALGKLQGQLLVGVINSVGVRRDAKAVSALTRLIGDANLQVASQALVALGQIATPESIEALHQSLASGSAAIRAAAADASLVGAERLVAQDQREAAVRLYDAVRPADVPRQVRAAATRGAILTRQSAGIPLLLEQLKADDDMFGIALRASRELPGSDVTQSLVGVLDGLSPARQVLLLRAIGDRQDAAASPAVCKLASSGPPEVRSAAIHVLGQLGDASAVTVLLEAVVSGDPAFVSAAQASLTKLRGSSADETIVAYLDRAAPGTLAILLDVAGQLAIPSAMPAALRAAQNPDEQVRLAAIKTLGRIVSWKEFAVLTDRLLAAESPPEVAAVQEALKVACLRMPDPDACVGKLLDCLPPAPLAAKCFLMDLLGSVGGTRALQAVSAAAEDSNEELQDAATRVLGAWKTADAAPELLKLARTLPSDKLKVRTLRGYIRIAQQMKLAPEQQLEMCEEALRAAQRDDERRLVLAVLGRIPTTKGMSIVVLQLAQPTLVAEATAAALRIGEGLVQSEPGVVADAMQQVLKSSVSGEPAAQAKKLLQQADSLINASPVKKT
ncbi:MAG: HEAT repeat domain-containing protein [Pirellulaceae bacterium]